MENKFKKGLFLGALLAIGGLIGLASTKKGKEILGQAKDKLEPMIDKMKRDCCAGHDSEPKKE